MQFCLQGIGRAGGRVGKELEKLCSELPFAHLQQMDLIK